MAKRRNLSSNNNVLSFHVDPTPTKDNLFKNSDEASPGSRSSSKIWMKLFRKRDTSRLEPSFNFVGKKSKPSNLKTSEDSSIETNARIENKINVWWLLKVRNRKNKTLFIFSSGCLFVLLCLWYQTNVVRWDWKNTGKDKNFQWNKLGKLQRRKKSQRLVKKVVFEKKWREI